MDGAQDGRSAMEESERYQHRARDAALVERCRDGDDRAFGELYDAWFDRVHDLAGRILRDRDLAAEVAQDTFLTVWRRLDTLQDPDAFGGWLLRIARNRALNVSERERRSTAVDDRTLAGMDSGGSPVSAPGGVEQRLSRAQDPTAAAEDAELVALVWSAADALGERDRTVLDLTLRHGLAPAEVGEVVGVNRNAANQLVHRVKGRLGSALGARVLWDGPLPRCEALAAALAAAGIDRFGPEAAQLATGHAESCEECSDRRRLRLQPEALFSAVPIAMAPVLLKQQTAAALEAAGVPMHGSAFGGASSASGPLDGGAGSATRPDGIAEPSIDGSVTPEESGSPTTGHGAARWAARVLAGLLVLCVALGMALLLGAEETGEVATVDLSASTTITTDSSTTTASTKTGPPTTATPTTDDDVIDAPPPPELPSTTQPGQVPTSTTTPAEVVVAVGVRPNQHPSGYIVGGSGSPLLEWAVTVGGIDPSEVEVSVTGPGVSTGGLQGSQAICPVPAPQAYCDAESGVYEYIVTVTGPGGSKVGERSATLTLVG